MLPPYAQGLPPHPPAIKVTRTYFMRIVKQQHLRDHSWRRQRTEGRELGAGCRLQLHSHGLWGVGGRKIQYLICS